MGWSWAHTLKLSLGHIVLLDDLLFLLRVVHGHVRLDQVLELAPVKRLQAHLVDLVENLCALLDAQSLEHSIDARRLVGHLSRCYVLGRGARHLVDRRKLVA